MNTVVETEKYRDCEVEIHYDEAGADFDPRADYSNLSRLVFAPSSRYENPNEVSFYFAGADDAPEDGGQREGESFGDWCVRTLTDEHGALYIVPVYRYEHSGVAYRVGTSNPFHDPWDSGQVGYAIVTAESAAEIGTSPEDFAAVVAAEVDDYSSWANGEVYWWRAVDPTGDTIESCGGYLGSEEWEHMTDEARHAIDWWHDQRDTLAENLMADAMAELLATVVGA